MRVTNRRPQRNRRLLTGLPMRWPLRGRHIETHTMSDPYARYTRLRFDRPHPKVLRITMDNGRMNTADDAMHGELADIWRDIDRDPTVNAAIITGAGKVFSAGGDFGMIQRIIDDFAARTRAVEGSAGDRLQRDQLLEASGERDARRRGRRRARLRHTGGRFDRDQRLPHHRRSYAAGRRRRRSRRDHLAAAVRHGQGEVLSAAVRGGARRGGGADRPRSASRSRTRNSMPRRSRSRRGSPRARRAPSASPNTRSTTGCARRVRRSMRRSALEFLGFTGPEVKEGLASHQEKRKPEFPPGSTV